MVAENEATIEDHAGNNFQYVPNILPNGASPHSFENIWDDSREVVVSINRETFPHKSESGGIKMCRKMPSWHLRSSVAATDGRNDITGLIELALDKTLEWRPSSDLQNVTNVFFWL